VKIVILGNYAMVGLVSECNVHEERRNCRIQELHRVLAVSTTGMLWTVCWLCSSKRDNNNRPGLDEGIVVREISLPNKAQETFQDEIDRRQEVIHLDGLNKIRLMGHMTIATY
jgi:hypothetical protein